MRFHILGTGAIGGHIASVLRPRMPVTLLLRSKNAVHDFEQRYRNTITYTRSDKGRSEIVGFDAESLHGDNNNNPIETLVVATKAQHAVDAVRSVQQRLTPQSTLVLLQNGMGLAEELLETLWPNKVTTAAAGGNNRPSFIVGVNRHSVERVKPFDIVHCSGWNDPEGGLMLGAMPHSNQTLTDKVCKVFADIPELNTHVYDWQELRRRMMRKLVVNAGLNPIAAILESRNGELLHNPNGQALLRGVCAEAAQILTELNATAEELVELVQGMLKTAAGNYCSTVQDMKAKRLTEVDYINGYLVRLARERNIPAPTNEFLVHMVHAKEHILGSK